MYEPVWKIPFTKGEALAALGDGGPSARAVAGGTDLTALVKSGAERPGVLVDLGRLEELGTIDSSSGGAVEIGATVTHRTLGRDESVSRWAPALAEACRTVGGPQVRARGTIGGNLANASPAADGSVGLLALGSTVVIESARGGGSVREVPLDGFFTGPGSTVLENDELVTRVRFERPGETARGAYLKSGQRNALAIAIASVAVVFEPDAGTVSIALGSVAPTPVRARAAEELFASEWRGTGDAGELLRAVAREAVGAASPIDDVRGSAEYRSVLVEVLTRRALDCVCL